MRTPDVSRRSRVYDGREFTLDGALVPPSEGSIDQDREKELEPLLEAVEKAAEFVFQQRLVISRLHGPAKLSKVADELLYTHDHANESRTALRQMLDLEDNLSRKANQYIQVSNVKALHFLNDNQYSCALQILLGAEAIVRKGGGKCFPFFSAQECIVLGSKDGFAQSVEDPRSANRGCVQDIFVPFFTDRHERMRQCSLAIVENNIGLYHFKIGEYELAGRRMSNALQLEELLDVETVGVTYFNLAQTQYQLGCMEEALTTISLAEESIEQCISNYKAQRNHLRRISGHKSEASTAFVSSLERRGIDVYLRWREGVRLLSRVLEMHGWWLQSKNAYKAALHRYEQSERWSSLEGPHINEEKTWKKELHQHIQECKRYLRHSGCVPKVPATSTLVAATAFPVCQRSTIVTTVLPRKVEILVDAMPSTPLQNGGGSEKREEGATQRRRQTQGQRQVVSGEDWGHVEKQRHVDVNRPSVGDAYRMPSEKRKMSSCDSASNSRHHRAQRCHPPWNSNTVIIHDNPKRGCRRSRNTGPHSYSGLQATSSCATSATSMGPCPMRRPTWQYKQQQKQQQQEVAEEEDESPHANSSTAPSAVWTPPDKGATCLTTVEQNSMVPHRFLSKRHIDVKRAWEVNGNPPVPLASAARIFSPIQCIHILQAFAHAGISLLETRQRKISSGMCFARPGGFTRSLFSHSRCSELHQASGALQDTTSGDNKRCNHPVSNTHADVAMSCRALFLDPFAVILAFLMVRRSSCLVRVKRLQQQYMKRMALMQLSTFGRESAQTHACTGCSNDSSLPADARESKCSCNCNQTSWGGEKKIDRSTSPHDDTSNRPSISEEKYQRRYNSLLRMQPKGGMGGTGCAAAMTANSHHKGDLMPELSYVSGPEHYSLSHVKSHVYNGSCDYNRVGKECVSAAWHHHPPRGDPSNTPQLVVDRERKAGGSCMPYQLYSRTPVVARPSSSSGVLDKDEVPSKLSDFPMHHPNFCRKSSFSRRAGSFITGATKELIRQRALREEAALIIQTVWREWRKLRQSEAEQQLLYR